MLNELNHKKEVILIVDDNPDMLEFLSIDLGQAYHVITESNPANTFNILKEEHIDLIISDVVMPEMDGFDLCEKIKTDLEYSHIPVILLTAKNTIQSKIEGLHSGADVYVEKPFDIEYLTAQVESLLKNRHKIKEYFTHAPLASIKNFATSKRDEAFLDQLNKCIHENLTNSELDVELLARKLNMSRPTLYRKINAVVKMSPNEVINLIKLKKAAELLQEGYRVNEVYEMVGFNSLTHFSRSFIKQFNITPSEFNKK